MSTIPGPILTFSLNEGDVRAVILSLTRTANSEFDKMQQKLLASANAGAAEIAKRMADQSARTLRDAEALLQKQRASIQSSLRFEEEGIGRINRARLAGIEQAGKESIKASEKAARAEVERAKKTVTSVVAPETLAGPARLRAAIAQEQIGTAAVTKERQRILALIDREIAALRGKDSLSNRELSQLRRLTLERERQASFLKGGPGLTAGTGAFLGQLERLLPAKLQGVASQLFSVVQGTQAVGAASAVSTGQASRLFSVFSGAGGIMRGVFGIVGAIAALGGVAAKSSLNLAAQNEQIQNTALVTGLSARQVQIFTALSKELGLSSQGIVDSFARLNVQLGAYRRGLETGDEETGRFIKAVEAMGVKVRDSAGQIRPLEQILGDFSEALRALPDPAERSQRALDALAIRGRELVPILLQSRGSLRDLLRQMENRAPIIQHTEELQKIDEAADRVKTAWDKALLSLREGVAFFIVNAPPLRDAIDIINGTSQQSKPQILLPPPADFKKLQDQALSALENVREKLSEEQFKTTKEIIESLRPRARTLVQEVLDTKERLLEAARLPKGIIEIDKPLFRRTDVSSEVLRGIIKNLGEIGRLNSEQVKQAREIAEGGVVQLQLEEAKNKLTEALKKNRGAEAVEAANTVKQLERQVELQREKVAASKADAKELEQSRQQMQGILDSFGGQEFSPLDQLFKREAEAIAALTRLATKSPALQKELQEKFTAIVEKTERERTKIVEEESQKQADKASQLLDARAKKAGEIADILAGVESDLAVARAEASGDALAVLLAQERKRSEQVIARARQLAEEFLKIEEDRLRNELITESQHADAKADVERQLSALRVSLREEEAEKIKKLRRDEAKRAQEQLDKLRADIRNEAGQLFDALVSGSKNFGDALKRTLLAAALSPVKLVFQATIAEILVPLVSRVKDGIKKVGEDLKKKGGLLGKIGEALSPVKETDKLAVETALNSSATDTNTLALNRNSSLLEAFSGRPAELGQPELKETMGLPDFEVPEPPREAQVESPRDVLGLIASLDRNTVATDALAQFVQGEVAATERLIASMERSLGLTETLSAAVGGNTLATDFNTEALNRNTDALLSLAFPTGEGESAGILSAAFDKFGGILDGFEIPKPDTSAPSVAGGLDRGIARMVRASEKNSRELAGNTQAQSTLRDAFVLSLAGEEKPESAPAGAETARKTPQFDFKRLLPSVGLLASAIARGRPGDAIGAGISFTGGLLASIGRKSGNKSLATAADIIGGAGGLLTGIINRDPLTAAFGGAQAGFAIGGPVGAIIGGVGGLIASLLRGESLLEKIQKAVKRQTVKFTEGLEFRFANTANPGDIFTSALTEGPAGLGIASAVEGELGSLRVPGIPTLGGTPLELMRGPGSSPSPANVAVTFNINTVDGESVRRFFERHGNDIAAQIGKRAYSTSSGLNRNLRTTMFPE